MGMSGLRSFAVVLRNSFRAEQDHFRKDLPTNRARALFKKHIELVEFETTSYCNRVCSFCPNKFIDRRSEKLIMPDHTWKAILQGLKEVDYDGTVVWSRYSEPLSEHQIVERIRDVRSCAPKARIGINSNGDYLDSDYLQRLIEAGLDRLWLDIYMPDDEAYNVQVAHKYHDNLLERIEKKAKIIATNPELASEIWLGKFWISIHVRNSTVMKLYDMSDRGGLISDARRTQRVAPCYAPVKHLVIDWDGSVLPCCQLRSDSPAHREAIVARVGIGRGFVDIFTAYAQLADWRSELRFYGPKKGPCANCNVSEYKSNVATRLVAATIAGDSTGSQVLRGLGRGLFWKRRRY